MSGQLEPLKDHSPVFHISKNVHNNDYDDSLNKVTMYYEYSKNNLARLNEILPQRMADSKIQNFEDFMTLYTCTVDECCKLTVNPSNFCMNIDKPRNRFQQFNSFTKTSYWVPLTSY